MVVDGSQTAQPSEGGVTERVKSSQFTIVWVFLAAAAMNLAFLLFYYLPQTKVLIGDEGYYFSIARAWSTGEQAPLNPLWPPLYPYPMSKLFAVFGVHRFTIQFVQIAMWLATGWFLWNITKRLTGNLMAARMTLILFLFSPETIAFSHFLWPEIFHLFFLFCALWLLIAVPEHWSRSVGAGVLLGLALLTKLLMLPFMPILIATQALFGSGSWQHRMKRACLLGLALVITIFPVMWHNSRIHGEFVIASSAIFNVWVGLNDVEKADFRNDIAGDELLVFQDSGSNIAERNRVYRKKILEKVRAHGVWSTLTDQIGKQYRRLFHYDGFFTTQLSGGARQAYVFEGAITPALLRCYAWFWHGLLLVTCAFGLIRLSLSRPGWPHIFGLFLGYNVALFLLVHVKTRFMVQMIPFLVFFSGSILARIAGIGWEVKMSRSRLVIGGLLATILIILGFWELPGS